MDNGALLRFPGGGHRATLIRMGLGKSIHDKMSEYGVKENSRDKAGNRIEKQIETGGVPGDPTSAYDDVDFVQVMNISQDMPK
jgi:hypothetical protein